MQTVDSTTDILSVYILNIGLCSSRNIHNSPREGIGISWEGEGGGEVEGFVKRKKFKEMYEAYLKFPKEWGVLEKIPSLGEVWIFSGITHYAG